MSDFTKSGDYFVKDLLREIWDKANRDYGFRHIPPCCG